MANYNILTFFISLFLVFQSIATLSVVSSNETISPYNKTTNRIMDLLEIQSCMIYLNNEDKDGSINAMEYQKALLGHINDTRSGFEKFYSKYHDNPVIMRIIRHVLDSKMDKIANRIMYAKPANFLYILRKFSTLLHDIRENGPESYKEMIVRNHNITNEDGPDRELAQWLVNVVEKGMNKDGNIAATKRFTKHVQILKETAAVLGVFGAVAHACVLTAGGVCAVLMIATGIGMTFWVFHLIRELTDLFG
ncbi:uncharacterized protein NDAI_0K02360 [Naumovozyma dairenensis CBS 421]|uniref:EF-hand domain-containing protein n=1 Tax=Naumovozyma dairenensis (strain ATCC 10597 / BCRC 20456 / CBS 421 / NBRC 0211 / NRRL Y-12639) TaxID=1071378 RepID=G0WI16_NAUDC|nr:hypothetical protein NDAI_0K02360 [Naumovozyma dairenensis CBS 421]CCD27427.1 hypothetical protein NDAI_0K02360 [Naumovozyma dairenensis CBS 421]